MRALLLAFLFAGILIVINLTTTTDTQFMNIDDVQAQVPNTVTFIVKKIVMGSTPNYDWEFIGDLGDFTIDKAGGETTFYTFYANDPVTIMITEKTKSNFIAYARVTQLYAPRPFAMTHIATVIVSIQGSESWNIEFSNSYSPSYGPPSAPTYPVGGELITTHKLNVLAPYLALLGIIAASLSFYISRKKYRS
jgi:hypothetical protein